MITFEQAVKLAAARLDPHLLPWAARKMADGWVIGSNTVEYPEAEKYFGCPYLFVSKEDGSVKEFDFFANMEEYLASPAVSLFYIEDGEIVVNPNIDEECADW